MQTHSSHIVMDFFVISVFRKRDMDASSSVFPTCLKGRNHNCSSINVSNDNVSMLNNALKHLREMLRYSTVRYCNRGQIQYFSGEGAPLWTSARCTLRLVNILQHSSSLYSIQHSSWKTKLHHAHLYTILHLKLVGNDSFSQLLSTNQRLQAVTRMLR